MTALFYLSGAVAVLATVLAITRTNAVHALLYLVVSFLSTALVFFALGAPFIAALEVIIYAGAIIVLFVFVVMLLNVGPEAAASERRLLPPRIWVGPAVLAALLAAELALTAAAGPAGPPRGAVTPQEVGRTLLGPYVLGVELASMLLLAGLIGAYHLGRRLEAAGSDAAGRGTPGGSTRARDADGGGAAGARSATPDTAASGAPGSGAAAGRGGGR